MNMDMLTVSQLILLMLHGFGSLTLIIVCRRIRSECEWYDIFISVDWIHIIAHINSLITFIIPSMLNYSLLVLQLESFLDDIGDIRSESHNIWQWLLLILFILQWLTNSVFNCTIVYNLSSVKTGLNFIKAWRLSNVFVSWSFSSEYSVAVLNTAILDVLCRPVFMCRCTLPTSVCV